MRHVTLVVLCVIALRVGNALASGQYPNAWLECNIGSVSGSYTANACYLHVSSGPSTQVAYYRPSPMISALLMDSSGPTYHFTGCTEITGPQTGWIPTCAATIANHHTHTATIYVDGFPGMTSSADASYDVGVIP